MAKAKTTVNFETEKLLRLGLPKKDLDIVGAQMLRAIKSSIRRGVSPVRGVGRFKSYAVDRAGGTFRDAKKKLKGKKGKRNKNKRALLNQAIKNAQKNKYPANVPGKNKKPVNLKLSGEMLKEYTYKTFQIINKIKLGFPAGSTSQLTFKKLETHNEGSQTGKNIPQRPLVPNKKGQSFTKNIDDIRLKELELRLSKLIDKGNN